MGREIHETESLGREERKTRRVNYESKETSEKERKGEGERAENIEREAGSGDGKTKRVRKIRK